MILIALVSLCAAMVNGALGYGFSTIAVPLALLVVSNRELNPAVVLVEIAMNAAVLWRDREAVPRIWRRVLVVAVALPFGVYAGTRTLVHTDPEWLRLGTLLALLPLILLQAAGLRRTIRGERAAGVLLGAGVGALYSVTTISGPPLALYFSNQAFSKPEFRAALGLVKLVVCGLTLAAYQHSGLLVKDSVQLLWVMLPAVVLGLPLGAWLIRHVDHADFRRLAMCLDAAIVAFGLAMVLRALDVATGPVIWLPLALVLCFDAALLWRHYRGPASATTSSSATTLPPTPLSELVP